MFKASCFIVCLWAANTLATGVDPTRPLVSKEGLSLSVHKASPKLESIMIVGDYKVATINNVEYHEGDEHQGLAVHHIRYTEVVVSVDGVEKVLAIVE